LRAVARWVPIDHYTLIERRIIRRPYGDPVEYPVDVAIIRKSGTSRILYTIDVMSVYMGISPHRVSTREPS
jgi:hypothetical protein